MSFSGKHALIVGGSSGMGFETTRLDWYLGLLFV